MNRIDVIQDLFGNVAIFSDINEISKFITRIFGFVRAARTARRLARKVFVDQIILREVISHLFRDWLAGLNRSFNLALMVP